MKNTHVFYEINLEINLIMHIILGIFRINLVIFIHKDSIYFRKLFTDNVNSNKSIDVEIIFNNKLNKTTNFIYYYNFTKI